MVDGHRFASLRSSAGRVSYRFRVYSLRNYSGGHQIDKNCDYPKNWKDQWSAVWRLRVKIAYQSQSQSRISQSVLIVQHACLTQILWEAEACPEEPGCNIIARNTSKEVNFNLLPHEYSIDWCVAEFPDSSVLRHKEAGDRGSSEVGCQYEVGIASHVKWHSPKKSPTSWDEIIFELQSPLGRLFYAPASQGLIRPSWYSSVAEITVRSSAWFLVDARQYT